MSSITIGDVLHGTGTMSMDGVLFQDPVLLVGGNIEIVNVSAGSNPVTLTAHVGSVQSPAGVGSTDVSASAVVFNGDVAPGASPGTLTVNGDVTLDASDSLTMELNGSTPGSEHDQLRVEGSNRVVTLGGAALSLSSPATFMMSDQIVLIDNVDVGTVVSGIFTGLPEGAAVVFGSNAGTISYVAGDGNDVAILVTTPVSLQTFTVE